MAKDAAQGIKQEKNLQVYNGCDLGKNPEGFQDIGVCGLGCGLVHYGRTVDIGEKRRRL